MYVVVVLSLNTSFIVETLPPNLVSGIIRPLHRGSNRGGYCKNSGELRADVWSSADSRLMAKSELKWKHFALDTILWRVRWFTQYSAALRKQLRCWSIGHSNWMRSTLSSKASGSIFYRAIETLDFHFTHKRNQETACTKMPSIGRLSICRTALNHIIRRFTNELLPPMISRYENESA